MSARPFLPPTPKVRESIINHDEIAWTITAVNFSDVVNSTIRMVAEDCSPILCIIILPCTFFTSFPKRPKLPKKERERSAMAAAAGASTAAPIKVAALCGSLRKGSYHRGLIRSGFFILLTLFSVLFISIFIFLLMFFVIV